MAKSLTEKLFTVQGLALVAIVLVVLNVGGLGDTVKDWMAPGAPSAPDGALPCLHDGATMTIGPMQTMFSPTDVTPATQYARVFVNGVNQGLKSDGATMEVSPGDQIEIYYGENASSGSTMNNFQYAAKQAFAVPCRSDFPTGDSTLDNDAYKLYNSTQEDSSNLSSGTNIVCFSNDDDTKIQESAPEDFATGDAMTIRCKLEGINKESFSPYKKPTLCFEYNSTVWDTVQLLDDAGTAQALRTKPVFSKAIAAGQDTICYEFVESVISNDLIWYKIKLEVSDTDATLAVDINITQRFFDYNWFRNTETGDMELGMETNENADVGSTYEFRDTIDTYTT